MHPRRMKPTAVAVERVRQRPPRIRIVIVIDRELMNCLSGDFMDLNYIGIARHHPKHYTRVECGLTINASVRTYSSWARKNNSNEIHKVSRNELRTGNRHDSGRRTYVTVETKRKGPTENEPDCKRRTYGPTEGEPDRGPASLQGGGAWGHTLCACTGLSLESDCLRGGGVGKGVYVRTHVWAESTHR